MNSSIAFVYIAGPFSPTLKQTGGEELTQARAEQQRLRRFTEENIRRAVALGVKVSRLGAFPVVPHAMTSEPEYEETQPYEFWIKATKELLSRCDAVLFLDNWHESKGARGENELAIDLGIARFFSLSDLAEWLLPEVARLNLHCPNPTLDTDPAPAPTLPPDGQHFHLSDLAADLVVGGVPLELEEFDSNPFVLATEQAVE